MLRDILLTGRSLIYTPLPHRLQWTVNHAYGGAEQIQARESTLRIPGIVQGTILDRLATGSHITRRRYWWCWRWWRRWHSLGRNPFARIRSIGRLKWEREEYRTTINEATKSNSRNQKNEKKITSKHKKQTGIWWRDIFQIYIICRFRMINIRIKKYNIGSSIRVEHGGAIDGSVRWKRWIGCMRNFTWMIITIVYIIYLYVHI